LRERPAKRAPHNDVVAVLTPDIASDGDFEPCRAEEKSFGTEKDTEVRVGSATLRLLVDVRSLK
jgi:hypothetical protein